MNPFSGLSLILRTNRVQAAAVAVVCTAVVAPAAASAASAAPSKAASSAVADGVQGAYCPLDESQSWKAFAAFGDTDDYFLSPSGDFEHGATDWTLRGAAVGPSNDDLGVRPGHRSLWLGLGTPGNPVAVSPVFCITNDHPVFRFTFRAVGAVGPLTTSVRYRGTDGETREQVISSRSTTAARPGVWQPSERLPLADALPAGRPGDVAAVELVFRAQTHGIATGYQVDNVLIDPYRQR